MTWTLRTGETLLADVTNLSLDLPVLIPDFLYGQTSTMLASDPGIGKSILSMQVALSLASGTTLFGTFSIPTPQPVYYLQLEGSYLHSIERIRLMRQKIPLLAENLCWDMGEGLNVLREQEWGRVEQRIRQFKKPALIVIDPLYMLVAGGLSEDRPASAVVRFSNALMQTFGAANWLNHHTHRARYQNGEVVQEDDPFYGSQWLKAHLDASWLMTRKGKTQVHVACKKDRHGVLPKEINLVYHEDSMTCENVLYAESSAMQKVLLLLAECKARNITISFSEIQAKTGVSHAHLRRLKNELPKIQPVKFINVPGKSTLWQPL